MSMTRKDFEVIADSFNRVVKQSRGLGLDVYRLGHVEGSTAVMREFIKVATVSNPNFDVDKFTARVNRGA